MTVGEIALFAQKRLTWFKRFLEIARWRLPPDTFERVFNQLDPKAFEGCFIAWVKEFGALAGLRHIAIDGKTLRHSFQKSKGLKMLHAVSAWATEQHLILGQVMTDADPMKSPRFPSCWSCSTFTGALITIDAMGYQKAIAAQIVKQGGDYLLAAKENQEHLFDDIPATVSKALDGKVPARTTIPIPREETGHGRQEQRTYTVVHNVEGIRNRAQWAKLTTVGMVYSEVTVGGETTTEVRYFIGSRRMRARKYGKALRGHWGIENNLHWQLDVSFGEDKSNVHQRNAGARTCGLATDCP